MQTQRKALYNLIRMNWVEDPKIDVPSWQVDDYRNIPLDTLFNRLGDLGVILDRYSFVEQVEDFDTPEDLVLNLVGEAKNFDQVYLLIFELWRRLAHDKPSLSIFCDELDHHMFGYDQGLNDNVEGVQSALIALKDILDDNSSDEISSKEAFQSVSEGCANDIESFLYDFAANQIDEENYDYAIELVDDFHDCVREAKWFEFLRIRLMALSDPTYAEKLLGRFLEDYSGDLNVDLLFDVLGFAAENGIEESFVQGTNFIAKLLENEGDFQDLLETMIDYYGSLNNSVNEQQVEKILKRRREQCDLKRVIDLDDADLGFVVNLLKNSCLQS